MPRLRKILSWPPRALERAGAPFTVDMVSTRNEKSQCNAATFNEHADSETVHSDDDCDIQEAKNPSDPYFPLLRAMIESNTVRFKKYLNDYKTIGNFNINFYYGAPYNGTLLHIACDKPNRSEFVKLLLAEKEIDVNILGEGGTPLHRALLGQERKLAHIEMLCDSKIEINKLNENGQTPIELAASYCAEYIVYTLLSHEDIDIDSKNHHDTDMPIRELICRRFPNLRPILPEVKVQDRDDYDGNRLLNLFALMYQRDLKELINLISHDKAQGKGMVNSDNGKYTLLQYACRYGLYCFVMFLVSCSRTKVGRTTEKEKKSALMLACEQGYYRIVRLLVERKPRIPQEVFTSAMTIFKEKARIWKNAMKEGEETRDHCECLRAILATENQININKFDSDGNTGLHIAARAGHLCVVH